jgi:hypothetical protein
MGKQSKAVQKALKDNNLTSKEKRNLRQEFGQDAVKKAKSKIQPTFDIDLPDPIVNATYTPGTWNPVYGTPGGMTQEQAAEYDIQSGLLNLKGTIDAETAKLGYASNERIAGIQSASSERVAGIGAEAQKYGYDQDRIAKQYVVDRQTGSAEKIAGIQGEYNLKLQDIVNAGLSNVESIRGEAGKETAKIAGEYGLKQEGTRQAGQEKIARIGEQSSFRNALLGAFSF